VLLMRGFLISAVAATLLALAPFANAFQIVESSSVPAATSLRVADPDDIRENIGNQRAATNGMGFPFSDQFRIGSSPTSQSSIDGNSPFLESPAIRSVPSQQR
jgi:hypothetical protein